MKDYSLLPPEQAIPAIREDIYRLLEAQIQGRLYYPNGTNASEWFMVVRMIEYLVTLVGHQHEEIVALKDRLGP